MNEPEAVISDAHGNRFGLEAVIADIVSRGISKIVCLGDTVGYGADPEVCLDLVRDKCRIVLRGNHDESVLDPAYALTAMNDSAMKVWDWTRARLAGERLAYLRTLQSQQIEGTIMYCHGSPYDPLDEYLFADSFWSTSTMDRNFKLIEPDGGAFIGHTHTGCLFLDHGGKYECFLAKDVQPGFEVPVGTKFIANVGSVGQPRDRDPRASYVIREGRKLTFCRVSYDIEAAVRRYAEIPEIDEHYGRRLREGR